MAFPLPSPSSDLKLPIIERTAHNFLLAEEDEEILSKLSDKILESIELFKLMKSSMFGREIRERLLNYGVCDGRNLPALSTVNKGLNIKLRIINKYSIKQKK